MSLDTMLTRNMGIWYITV